MYYTCIYINNVIFTCTLFSFLRNQLVWAIIYLPSFSHLVNISMLGHSKNYALELHYIIYMEFMHSQLHFELVLLHVHVHLNGSITYNRLGLHTSKLIYVLIREIFHFQKAPKMRSLFDIYNFAI